MAKKRQAGKAENKILFAFITTFLSIIGFVIALIAKRKMIMSCFMQSRA